MSDDNLHHPQTATAGDISSPGTAKYFYILPPPLPGLGAPFQLFAPGITTSSYLTVHLSIMRNAVGKGCCSNQGLKTDLQYSQLIMNANTVLGYPTDIDRRFRNLCHFDPGMGFKLKVFGFFPPSK